MFVVYQYIVLNRLFYMILPENIQTLIYHRVEYVLIFCFISPEMTKKAMNKQLTADIHMGYVSHAYKRPVILR